MNISSFAKKINNTLKISSIIPEDIKISEGFKCQKCVRGGRASEVFLLANNTYRCSNPDCRDAGGALDAYMNIYGTDMIRACWNIHRKIKYPVNISRTDFENPSGRIYEFYRGIECLGTLTELFDTDRRIFGIIKKKYGLSKKIIKEARLNILSIEQWEKAIQALREFESIEFIEKMGLCGQNGIPRFSGGILIPYFWNGKCVRLKERKGHFEKDKFIFADKKRYKVSLWAADRETIRNGAFLYNVDKIPIIKKRNDYTYITDNEFSALAMREAGLKAIGFCGRPTEDRADTFNAMKFIAENITEPVLCFKSDPFSKKIGSRKKGYPGSLTARYTAEALDAMGAPCKMVFLNDSDNIPKKIYSHYIEKKYIFKETMQRKAISEKYYQELLFKEAVKRLPFKPKSPDDLTKDFFKIAAISTRYKKNIRDIIRSLFIKEFGFRINTKGEIKFIQGERNKLSIRRGAENMSLNRKIAKIREKSIDRISPMDKAKMILRWVELQGGKVFTITGPPRKCTVLLNEKIFNLSRPGDVCKLTKIAGATCSGGILKEACESKGLIVKEINKIQKEISPAGEEAILFGMNDSERSLYEVLPGANRINIIPCAYNDYKAIYLGKEREIKAILNHPSGNQPLLEFADILLSGLSGENENKIFVLSYILCLFAGDTRNPLPYMYFLYNKGEDNTKITDIIIELIYGNQKSKKGTIFQRNKQKITTIYIGPTCGDPKIPIWSFMLKSGYISGTNIEKKIFLISQKRHEIIYHILKFIGESILPDRENRIKKIFAESRCIQSITCRGTQKYINAIALIILIGQTILKQKIAKGNIEKAVEKFFKKK